MNILYISYDGVLDILGSSQIVSYLINLAERDIKFTLLTYEKEKELNDTERVGKLRAILAGKNIKWEALRYHKSPSFIATFFDVFCGIIKSFIIILRDRIKIIHARSFIGAIPALFLAKLLNLKFVFDMRGFWPDERIEGRIWKKRGIIYRIAKWFEVKFILNSDWIVCLSQEAQNILQNTPEFKKRKAQIAVIPSCVDTSRFVIKSRNDGLFKRLKLDGKFVFVYFGSLGSWYLLDDMIGLFSIAKQMREKSFFLFLTPNRDLVIARMENFGIQPQDYYVDFVNYEQVPVWLSLADCSLFFIRPSFSKKSSCPTKFAESLACGIPVLINAGIGDTDKIVKERGIGVVVERLRRQEYSESIDKLFTICQDSKSLKNKCRNVVQDLFSLQVGVELYLAGYQKLKKN